MQPTIQALFAGKQYVFVYSFFVLLNGENMSCVPLALSLFAVVMTISARLLLHSTSTSTPLLSSTRR